MDDEPTPLELAIARADVRRAREACLPVPPAALDVFRRAGIPLPPAAPPPVGV